MVSLNENGSVRSAGPIDYVLGEDEEFQQAVKEDVMETKEAIIPNAEKPEEKKVAAKLIKAEEKSEGRISRQALFRFFR